MTRVRNEADIITSTLDYYADLCPEGIYVYDDGSTDDTPEICADHPAVRLVTGRSPSSRVIYADQGMNRWETVRGIQSPWILCFDADERVEIDENLPDAQAYTFRLHDFYITAQDEDSHWLDREFCGPEYRDIIMLWQAKLASGFVCREPRLPNGIEVASGGWCRHYGKAISVERFEAKCRQYQNPGFPGGYAEKWAARAGKAVHSESDYGEPLIRWDERREKGIPDHG